MGKRLINFRDQKGTAIIETSLVIGLVLLVAVAGFDLTALAKKYWEVFTLAQHGYRTALANASVGLNTEEISKEVSDVASALSIPANISTTREFFGSTTASAKSTGAQRMMAAAVLPQTLVRVNVATDYRTLIGGWKITISASSFGPVPM